MSLKTNIRSFRYSDEVATVLEKFKGNSLNEKFENLIMYCFWELKKIDKQLAQKHKEYTDLCQRIDEKRKLLYEYDSLQNEKQRISGAVAKVTMDIFDYREKQKKLMEKDDVIQEVKPGEADRNAAAN